MEKQKITRSMKISDMVNEFPDIIPLIMAYGLHCVGCSFSDVDTIESGAKLHGMSDEDIDMMIKDSNDLLKELEEDSS